MEEEEEKQMEEMKKEEEGESRRRGTRYSQTHSPFCLQATPLPRGKYK